MCWIALIRDGERAESSMALRLLYERYGRTGYSLARRVCRDDGLAQEAVQDALLEVWRSAARFDPSRGTVGAWVLMLVHRRAVDAVRRENRVRQRTAPVELADREPSTGAAPGADEIVLAAEDARRVRAALGRLPGDQRRVLELCFYGGYTHVEVAERLQMPVGTVKSRLYGGVHRLRRWLVPMALQGS